MTSMKVCRKCGVAWPMSEYAMPSREQSYCRQCRMTLKRDYRRRHGAVSREEQHIRALARKRERERLKAERMAQPKPVPLRYLYRKEYFIWQSMIQRCTRMTHPKYRIYGARGIRVCDRWRHSFPNFLADVGPKPSPGLSIDRIDNNGNYEPGNVRWADSTTQSHNRNYPRKTAGPGNTQIPAGDGQRDSCLDF